VGSWSLWQAGVSSIRGKLPIQPVKVVGLPAHGDWMITYMYRAPVGTYTVQVGLLISNPLLFSCAGLQVRPMWLLQDTERDACLFEHLK